MSLARTFLRQRKKNFGWKERRNKVFFEPLEPRLLLSAISPEAEAAINSGVMELKNWAANLDTFDKIAQKLPIVDTAIGAALDSDTMLDEKLFDPVKNYFESTESPTTEGLAAALDALPETVGNVTGDLIGNEYIFDLVFQSTRNQSVPINLSRSSADIELEVGDLATVDLGATLNFDFSFGFDTSASKFFIRVDQLSADAVLDVPGLNFDLRLGFIDVGVQNATAKLNASSAITVIDPDDADGKGYLTVSDLEKPLASWVTPMLSGTASMSIPITSNLIPGEQTLGLSWADVSQPTNVTPDFSGLENAYQALAYLKPDTFISGLTDFSTWADFLNDENLLGRSLPLIGTQLTDVIDLSGLLNNRLVTGVGSFDSIETLATRLSQVGGMSNVVTTLTGEELRYTFDLNAHISKEVAFAWGLSSLFNLSLDIPDFNVMADVSSHLTFGVNLSTPTPTFFIASDGQNPELNINASLEMSNIQAQGGVGFLSVEVNDGQVRISTNLSLDLHSPVGRITPDDFSSGGGAIGEYVNFNIGGSASLSLDIGSALIGSELKTLTADWPDLGNPNSFTTNAEEFLEFKGFENIGAEAYSFGLNQLTAFMASLASGNSFLQTKLPLIDKSLAEIIDFQKFFSESVSNATDFVKDPSTGILSTPFQNSRELFLLLQGLPGMESVDLEATSEDIQYILHLEKSLEKTFPFYLDIGSFMDLSVSGDITVYLDTVLDLSFGVSKDTGNFFMLEKDPGQTNFSVSGNVSADLNAGARLGFLDVSIQAGSATIAAGLGIRLVDPNSDSPPTAGKITTEEIMGAGLLSITEVNLSGNATVTLPLHSDFLASLGKDGDGTLFIEWPDITNPGSFNPPDTSEIADMFDFNNISVGNVLEGLRSLPNLLNLLTDAAAFGENLPFIGSNLKDVIAVGEKFQGYLDQLASFSTAQGLQVALEGMLGKTVGVFITENDIQFDIEFSDSFSRTINYSIDEPVPGTEDFLGEFFGVQLSGTQQIDGTASIHLGIGLSLQSGIAPTDRFYLLAGPSSAEMTFHMQTATPIGATITLGFLSVGIEGGSITISSTSNADDPASAKLVFEDPNKNDDKITLAEILANLTNPGAVTGTPELDGTIDVMLPLEKIPGITPEGSNPFIQIIWDPIQLDTPPQIITNDLDSYFEGASNFDISTALSGIEKILEMIGLWADTEILNYKLPLIEVSISDVFDFAGEVSTLFEAIQNANPTSATTFDQAVVNAVTSAGLDPNNVSLVPSPGHTNILNSANFDVRYDVSFNYSGWKDKEFPFGFSLGGGIFALDAKFQPEVNFDLDFTFGLNKQDGFFIVDDATDPEMKLEAFFDLTIDHLGGEFGPVELGILGGQFNLGVLFNVDLVDPNPPASGGRKITTDELQANFGTVFIPNINGEASLKLPMGLLVGGEDGIGVLAKFTASWDASDPLHFKFGKSMSSDPELGFDRNEDGEIDLGDFTIELGEVVQKAVGPFLEKINEFNPLPEDLIETLNTPLPILNETPMEVILEVAGAEEWGQRISLLFDILDILDQFENVPIGGAVDVSGYFDGSTPPPEDPPGDDDVIRDFLDALKDYGISIPIVDDPAGSVVNLLMGQDLDLIRWNPEPFEFGEDYFKSWPIYSYGFPGILELALKAYLTGGWSFFGDLDIGLSTRGLLKTGNLFDGFFVGDNIEDGKDNFEIGFEGYVGVGASGGVQVLGFLDVAEVFVEGGIDGTIGLDLSDLDPNEDLDPCDRRISRLEPNHPGADNRIYFDEMQFYIDHST